MAFFSPKPACAGEWQSSSLHQAIAAGGEQWLNTERPLTADDLKGRIVLLDFWTFCCINCIHVIPDLHYLEKKFGHKLTVIGVHSAKFSNEKDTANIRNAVLRYDVEHPVVNDSAFRIWNSFGVRAWPTLILIRPDGRVAEHYSGEGHRQALEEDIAGLIKDYPGLVETPLPLSLEKHKAPPSILSFPGKLEYAPDIGGSPALFVSDSSNNRVLALRLDGQVFARIGSGREGNRDGAFAAAEFNTPQGLVYRDGLLYIADTGNHTIRLADLKKQEVTTIAGTGRQGYKRNASNDDALETPLASPWDLTFYPDTDHLVIAMAGTHQLWHYDIPDRTVSVIAGNGRESIDDGALPYNSLSQPSGLTVLDDKLYFVDSETSSLRVYDGKEVTTLIGTGLFDFGFRDGTGKEARMQHAIGVGADERFVYIADSYNHAIRKYDPASGALTTLVGGPDEGLLDEPNDVLAVEGTFYMTDTNNNRIRRLKAGTLESLDVMPMADRHAVDEYLPNAQKVEVVVGSGKEGVIEIALPGAEWKINDQAPSWLALFDQKGAAVKDFSFDEIRTLGLTMPALAAGEPYRLRGTLYYCEKQEGAVCLVGSYDATLTADKDNGNHSITIRLAR